jgi:apolipoprotein N-acyltransferase
VYAARNEAVERTTALREPVLRSLAFAACAGLLVGLAGAPLELTAPAFLAPAALMLALEPEPGRAVRARRALLYGLVMGVVTNVYSMGWVVGLLEEFGGFPLVLALPVGALLWIGQSLLYVAASMLSAELIRARLPGWLAIPAALALVGSLTPALFPWRYGVSQIPFTAFVQVAELGSLPLVDLLVALVGCGLVAALRTRGWVPAVVAALALLVPVTYGALRLHQVRAAREGAPRLRVGVVQPNIGIHDKHDPRQHVAHLQLLRAMTRELEADGAELVLWPESAHPFPVHRDARTDLGGPLGAISDGVRGPVLTGVLTTSGPAGRALVTDARGVLVGSFPMGRDARYNSAVAFERGGRVSGIADKVRLLAFGEYVPFWDWIPPLRRFPRGLTPGEGAQLVSVAGARIGVLNCYEDLLADHVRWQAGYAPAFWANLTNNAWFGDTNAPHLHHMNARLRAVETRRDLVRAVNTGVSGHTLATGEDAMQTGTFVPARFLADVRLLEGSTPWVTLGDWVTPTIGGALMGFVLACGRRRRGR